MSELIERIGSKRIVPVVVIDRVEAAEPLAEALLEGGLDVMEITFRTAAAEESIRRITKRFPEMLMGAGTLLEVDHLARARDAGAVFGLAPGLNPILVAAAAEHDMLFTPGVTTPSEIDRGMELGCSVQKFFPAEPAGGAKMLAAIAAPFAHRGVKFVPTGGIHAGNMASYLAMPTVLAIGGSWMVSAALIKDGDWAGITRLTREALSIASQA